MTCRDVVVLAAAQRSGVPRRHSGCLQASPDIAAALWAVGLLLSLAAAPARAASSGQRRRPDQAAGIADAWAVNDGEKVKRDDLANPNRAQNSVWDGRKVTIFGARNEIVAFQLIIQAGPEGAKAVAALLPELVHRRTGEKLVALAERAPLAVPGRGGHIERFTEHYIHIERPSPPGWFYARSARPKDMVGWTPDALVPSGAKKGKGGAPFDIPPSQNQGVWFDVYIPRKGAPAGVYEGTLAVTEGGETQREIPVSLRVFDFRLPDETHFRAMIWFSESGVTRRHGSGGDGLVARYHRLAHRHRVEFTHAYGPNPKKPHMTCITGAAFTPAAGYVGPGEGVGYEIIPASFYGISRAWQGSSARGTADAFMSWLRKIKPKAVTFLYITDEPPESRFAWIKSIGDHHHANPGPGGKIPMFVTKGPKPGLEGAIDIWCTVSGRVDLEKVKEERAKGRRWWYYNGQRPQAGTQITGAPAVDPRVAPWACWKYGIELWFYWHANHWKHNNQYPRGDQNVWVDPVTFGGSGGINGDGVLARIDQDAVHREQDRGIAGPIASIRLKNIRRGMQDYEYLWLADKNGLGAQARAVADACVPAAFSEAKGDVSWSVRGSDWDAQRLVLAKLLEQKLSRKRISKAGTPGPGSTARARPTEAEVAAAEQRIPGLRRAVIDGVAQGKTVKAYVDLAGRPTRARVVGADEEAIVLSASGMEARVGWSTLSPRRFYGVVRKYTDDHKALATYCRGMGLLEEAEVEESEE